MKKKVFLVLLLTALSLSEIALAQDFNAQIQGIINAIPKIEAVSELKCRVEKRKSYDYDYLTQNISTAFSLENENATKLDPLRPKFSAYRIFINHHQLPIYFDQEDDHWRKELSGFKYNIRYYSPSLYTPGLLQPAPGILQFDFKGAAYDTLSKYCEEFLKYRNHFNELARIFSAGNSDTTISGILMSIKDVFSQESFKKTLINMDLSDEELVNLIESKLEELKGIIDRINNYYPTETTRIDFSNIEKVKVAFKEMRDGIKELYMGFLKGTYFMGRERIKTNPGDRERAVETFKKMDKAVEKIKEAERSLRASLKFEPGEIKTDPYATDIAVFPPGIFGQPGGLIGYKAISPQTIFDKLKNFLFELSPWLFVILIIGGGFIYLLVPYDPDKFRRAGWNWISFAIAGYFLLLISTGIITLLKNILGVP